MPTTIYTAINVQSGNATQTNFVNRSDIQTTGPNQGQLRITLLTRSDAGGSCVIDHAGIGLTSTGNEPQTQAGTIKQLFFNSGNASCTIAAGGTQTSDWLTFSGGTVGTPHFIVDLDINPTNGAVSYSTGESMTNWHADTSNPPGAYNIDAVIIGNYTSQANVLVLIRSIETQAAGTPLALMPATLRMM